MPHSLSRRRALSLGAGATAVAALAPSAAWASPFTGDAIKGDPNAAVTVIEYASFTCPHCAAFHRDTYPRLQANYIDTGKVKFIMREVYFDRTGLWVAMVARCGGEAAYFPMADQFLNNQADWARAADVVGEIQKVGRLNGLSNADLEACLSDQDFAKTLVEKYQREAEADGVDRTPTFFINGEKVTGNMQYDEFAALIDAHL
ncbi:MAG: DsbA family protein [Pseudomonadota bacterium]